MSKDPEEAAKFIIHVLLRRDDLRAQFQFALSEGKDGAFANGCARKGLKQYHIPETAEAAEQIREVFEQNPAASIRQLYTSFRPDLRPRPSPRPCCQPGNETSFVGCLFMGEWSFLSASEEIYWFLMESAEVPAREFEITYDISTMATMVSGGAHCDLGEIALLDWAKTRHPFK